MTDQFADPTNISGVIEEIRESSNLGKVMQIVDRLYPKWILGLMPGYSEDYPSLQKNWEEICAKGNVTPRRIILVEDIFFDEKHKILQVVSELLTLSGFCVRCKRDLFPCNVCGRALPQSHLYDLLKSKGEKVPDVWTVLCEKC